MTAEYFLCTTQINRSFSNQSALEIRKNVFLAVKILQIILYRFINLTLVTLAVTLTRKETTPSKLRIESSEKSDYILSVLRRQTMTLLYCLYSEASALYFTVVSSADKQMLIKELFRVSFQNLQTLHWGFGFYEPFLMC